MREAVGIFLVVLLMALAPEAESGLPDWNYFRPVTITNDTGGTLTNYQVLVTLTTAIMGNPYTNVNADGSDLRFYNDISTVKYDYWIEIWDNTGTSRIWVEVPSIPTGGATMIMWYGNSGASSESDGEATFVFFDDFPGTSLDGTKWSTWDCNASVSSSVLTITNIAAWGGMNSNTEFSLPYVFGARAQKTTTYGLGQVGLEKYYESDGDYTLDIFDIWEGTQPQAYATSKTGGVEEWKDAGGTWDLSTWYRYWIKGKSDEVKYYRDYELKITETNTSAIPAGAMSVLLSSGESNDVLKVDYCFIGKYASPEPATSVGNETLIELSYFKARPLDSRVLLEWKTETEIDNEGFNLLRSGDEDGQYVQINRYLIPSEGVAGFGAEYDYTDFDVKNGVTYYYFLEDIDIYGKCTLHGPVSATPNNIVLIWPVEWEPLSLDSSFFSWIGSGYFNFKVDISSTPDFTGSEVLSFPESGWTSGQSLWLRPREWAVVLRKARSTGWQLFWRVRAKGEDGQEVCSGSGKFFLEKISLPKNNQRKKLNKAKKIKL